MLKIAICDDEEKTVKCIYEEVSRHMQKREVDVEIDYYLSGNEMLDNGKPYDLYFLDISMPDIGGFEVAERIRRYDLMVEIIYITNHDNYINRAMEVRAFAYIEKSHINDQMEKTLDRYVAYMNQKHMKREIGFPKKNGSVKLYAENISHFKVVGNNKIDIILNSNEIVRINDSMRAISEKMKSYQFIMVNQSFVVNMFYIERKEKDCVIMKNQELLEISQSKRKQVRDAYLKYVDQTKR